MQLVEQATIFPAECALIPSATGPFIDTHRVDAEGRRVYISLEAVNELHRVAAEAGRGLPGLQAELVRAQYAEIEQLQAQVGELARLREAVGYTLEAGRGAVQKKDGTQQLRSKPGQKAITV